MDISSDEELSNTPPNLIATAKAAISSLLPEKSKRQYEKTYEQFKDWCTANGANNISENVLLAYFAKKSKKVKSSTLWAVYSMLKLTLNVRENVDFTKLDPFLKKLSVGHRHPKKSKVLTREEINQFIFKIPKFI